MSTKERILAEIKKKIEANKTKNGFPAGTLCAARIEAYETLVSFINSLPDDSTPKRDEEWIRQWLHDYFANIGEKTWIHREVSCQQVLAWIDTRTSSEEHTAAAIAVLNKRADVCREVINQRIETKRYFDVSFYAGEKQGYEQAIDLLESPTESIEIELKP